MRKLFVLLLICSSAFAQNFWQNEITLNSIPAHCKINSCVSSKGVHIVYTYNGGVKYALSSPNGSIIKQDKVIENEGAGCSLPNVVSINNEVYAIYVKNNTINVAKSTDLGDTWNIGFSFYSLTTGNYSALITLLEEEKVHMTWVGGNDVHYVCFYYNSSTKWDHYKRVTDVEGTGGEMPGIAVSQDRVHISYKTSSLFAKTRDMFKSDYSWQSSPQLITDELMGYVLKYQSIYSINNQLHAILRNEYNNYNITHYVRSTDNVTWQQTGTILSTRPSYDMITAKTQNNRIHILYFDKDSNYFMYRYLENDTWSAPIARDIYFNYTPTLNVDGNDLYLTSNYDELTPSSIKMRRYDDSPLMPANYTITSSQAAHPYLQWSLNTQADIQNYFLERSKKNLFPGSQWSAWETLPAIVNTQNYYEDLSICNAGSGPWLVRYRLRVKDYTKYSDYTNNQQIGYGDAEKRIGPNDNTIKDYALLQNYPNPFNPSTVISYRLKEGGFVKLKVYDIRGELVKVLVDEMQEAGVYKAEFNGKGLASGVYIYRIEVMGQGSNIVYSDMKKTILLK